jgi:hypothetical protein
VEAFHQLVETVPIDKEICTHRISFPSDLCILIFILWHCECCNFLATDLGLLGKLMVAWKLCTSLMVSMHIPNISTMSYLPILWLCSRYSDWLWAGRQTGRSSSPGRVKNLFISTSSRPVLGPTQPPIQWVPGALSPGGKQPGREAGHSPPTSAEVKKTWI